MTDDQVESGNSETQGLQTRHVFLDTEVYHRFGHNLNSAPLRDLGQHIEEGLLQLHITDITLSEIRRQMHDEAATLAQEVASLTRRLQRWRSRGGSDLPDMQTIDGTQLGERTFRALSLSLSVDWQAIEHDALALRAEPVFNRYFQRQPPFDDAKSKEFPDAFVIAALVDWCATTSSTMYVVTRDKAMQRAAEASGLLFPVSELAELLEIATAAETPEIVDLVRRLLASPESVEPIYDFIRDQIGWLGTVYVGQLLDGEAHEVEVIDGPQFEVGYVLSASSTTVSLLLRVKVPLMVQVSYDDVSGASYDREESVYIGAERLDTEFEDEQVIRLAVTVDRENETVQGIEFITQDIYVSESNDWDK